MPTEQTKAEDQVEAEVRTSVRGRLRSVLYGGTYLDEDHVKQLIETQKEMGGSLYENLCKQDNLSQIDRAAFFCDLFERLAYFDASNYRVPTGVLTLISREMAEKYKLVPVGQMEGTLTVAMANPLDLVALDEVSKESDHDVLVVVSTSEQIQQAIKNNYHKLEAEEKARVRLTLHAASEEEMQVAVEQAKPGSGGSAKAGASEAEEHVVHLVELMLNNAIGRDASDIHLEPFENSFRLRYRQDGKLIQVLESDRGVYSPIVSRLKIMSSLDIAEHRIPQDGRMKMAFEDREIDFRVSILPTQHGEKVVMRILDKGALKLDFTDMGFEPAAQEMFLRAIGQPNGICLVTGPTGSGKSTTLYSALNNLNQPDTNLITLEDPVEYNIFGINQVQCNTKVGLTFASGLRSILRQDPDVIMVGEIRDQETADIAIKCALTGHLVLSTLHTNDAPGAISRLIDMGAEPFMLSASLNLLEAQRLVRRICDRCKKPAKMPQTFLDRHRDDMPDDVTDPTRVYQGEGCKHCNGSGYKGRTCVVEIMEVSPAIKEMIAAGSMIAEITARAREEGMITLMQNGLRKVLAGITTLEEVMRVASA